MARSVPSIEQLQAEANALLGSAPQEDAAALSLGAEPGPSFSAFVPAQLARAVELAQRLMRIADEQGAETGLQAALSEARELAQTEPAALVQYALQLFIVHHAEGSRLSIPPIDPLPEQERRAALSDTEAEGDPERRLDYLREDPLLNEHHRHWHTVYPGSGSPITGRLQDRQGELFVYMHEQMLARYDAERLALGLEPVKPFADYRQPIQEAYADRPSGQQLVDVDRQDRSFTFTVSELEQQRDTVATALTGGHFKRADLKASLAALAAVEEPTIESEQPEIWHHGAGHVLAAWIMHPQSGGQMGPIGSTRTAIRDPFFWRWHKHIDNLAHELQEQFDEHTFTDAPPVLLRGDDDPAGPDLILALASQLPDNARADPELARQWGEQTFGGPHFDQRPDPANTTAELVTFFTESPQDPNAPDSVPILHLDHEPFAVFIRIHNDAGERKRIVFRLFLAPEQLAGDRRAWIELDKFDTWLEPHSNTVVHRPSELASVARKPATRPPQFIQPPADSRREQYCRCGWPYHLLLPRGSEDGMAFRLAAIVTDYALDHIKGDPNCGSLSFCGSVDAAFPDQREMGYPFNRPFRTRTITETLAGQPNMAARSLTIRHRAT
jgi:tyrosinase